MENLLKVHTNCCKYHLEDAEKSAERASVSLVFLQMHLISIDSHSLRTHVKMVSVRCQFRIRTSWIIPDKSFSRTTLSYVVLFPREDRHNRKSQGCRMTKKDQGGLPMLARAMILRRRWGQMHKTCSRMCRKGWT